MNNKIIIAVAFIIFAQSIRVSELGLTATEDFQFTDDFSKLNVQTPLVFFGPEEIEETTTYYMTIKEQLLEDLQDSTIQSVDSCLVEILSSKDVVANWLKEIGIFSVELTAAQLGEINYSTNDCVSVNGDKYTVKNVLKFIAVDHEFTLPEDEESIEVEDEAVGSWNIDRINQASLPLDKKFTPNLKQPEKVHVYICDTGIEKTHVDLKEFVAKSQSEHFTAFSGSRGGDRSYDAQGHGTHVSGTVVSRRWGYFHNSVLHAVKILSDRGSGSYSGIINGMNWVIGQHKKHGKASVVNMSLGASRSTAINNGVDNMVKKGIHTVVSAGNNNHDSAKNSPASASLVITVGSTDRYDRKSSFSNYGKTTNIWAGGSSVTSSYPGNRLRTMSGTSMSSPTTAGVVATLASLFPKDDHTALKTKLYCMAEKNKIGKDRNLLQDTQGECWKNGGGGEPGKCDCSDYSAACNKQCGSEGEAVYVKDMQCWTHWLKKQCTKCLCSNNKDVTADIDGCGNQCRYSFLS